MAIIIWTNSMASIYFYASFYSSQLFGFINASRKKNSLKLHSDQSRYRSKRWFPLNAWCASELSNNTNCKIKVYEHETKRIHEGEWNIVTTQTDIRYALHVCSCLYGAHTQKCMHTGDAFGKTMHIFNLIRICKWQKKNTRQNIVGNKIHSISEWLN